MTDNIILIGFMGSGKSSVGRVLAKHTRKQFLDTDSLIESSENKTVTEIFEQLGQVEFRRIETELFAWMKDGVQNAVVSVGGGMPTVVHNLKDAGTVYYIKVDFETVVARLSENESKKRPLMQNLEFARKIYDERLAVYAAAADFCIDGVGSAEEVAERILEKL